MLARVLAVLLGLVLATSAQADPQRLPIILHCDDAPGTILSMVQQRYGEQPFAQGEGVVQLATGDWIELEILTMVNPSTGSYSIIGREPITGTECMILAGAKFGPVGTKI